MEYDDNYCILAIALLHPIQLTPEQAAKIFYEPLRGIGHINWTGLDKKIADLYRAGYTLKEVADTIHLSRTTIAAYLKRTNFFERHGIEHKEIKHIDSAALKKIDELIQAGVRMADIARAMRMGPMQIYRAKERLRREGVLCETPWRT